MTDLGDGYHALYKRHLTNSDGGGEDRVGLDPFPIHCDLPWIEENWFDPFGANYQEPFFWQGEVSRNRLRRADRWFTFDELNIYNRVGFLNNGRRPKRQVLA